MIEGGFNEKKFKELFFSGNELLKPTELAKEYKANNIIKERVELFRHFTLNICYHGFSTYLGREFLDTEEKILGHYEWCFFKTCAEFKEEGFDFSENDEIFHYFYEYFKQTIYSNPNLKLEFLYMDWTGLLDYDRSKTKLEIATMIEIYDMFDYTIKEKINEVI